MCNRSGNKVSLCVPGPIEPTMMICLKVPNMFLYTVKHFRWLNFKINVHLSKRNLKRTFTTQREHLFRLKMLFQQVRIMDYSKLKAYKLEFNIQNL